MTEVLVVGTCDPQFGRNQQIVRLLEKAGCNVRVQVHSMWNGDKTTAVLKGKRQLFVRACVQYLKVVGTVIRAGVRRRPDVVFVLHPSQFDAVVVGVLCKVLRLPMVIDFFVSLHETVVDDRGLANSHSLSSRILKRCDRWAARLATHVIADTPEDVAFFAQTTRTSPQKWSVMWVGANPAIYQPKSNVPVDSSTVLFYGTYIPLQGIEYIVRASAHLPSQCSLRLIGDGQERDRIEEIVSEENLPVTFIDAVSEEELTRHIASAAICLGVFGDGAKTARVIPNKVFQCVAMGKAVITGDTPAVAILGDSVVRVPVGDFVSIARAISDLMENGEKRDQLGQRARHVFEQLFNEEKLASDMRDVVISALAR
jgi:glycosyltransferase involved in cell wall biosynthesis